jgi:mRNA-degrading endonuclease toxin of MazEF toxin-antitoxin module
VQVLANQREVGVSAGQRPSVRGRDRAAKESVANVSQVVTLDKAELTERVGKLPKMKFELVLSGIDVVLGR